MTTDTIFFILVSTLIIGLFATTDTIFFILVSTLIIGLFATTITYIICQ